VSAHEFLRQSIRGNETVAAANLANSTKVTPQRANNSMRNAFDNAAKFRTPKNMQTPTRTEKEAESEDTVKKNADSIRKVDDDEA